MLKALEILETLASLSASLCQLINIARWYILLIEIRSGCRIELKPLRMIRIILILLSLTFVVIYAGELTVKIIELELSSTNQQNSYWYVGLCMDEIPNILIITGYLWVWNMMSKTFKELIRESFID